MRQIKFTSYGSSSAFGNFGPGDILRCSDDEARHFVDDAACAVYLDAAAAAAAAPAPVPATEATPAAPVQTSAPDPAAPAPSAPRKRAAR